MTISDDESTDRAYTTFVRAENDVEGLLAYSLYKRHEIFWLKDHISETGKKPTPSEGNAFIKAVITSENQYRVEATNALIGFAEEFVEQRRSEIERDAIAGRIAQSTSFGRTVLSSIIGFFAVSVILIIIALIVQFLGVDLLDVLRLK